MRRCIKITVYGQVQGVGYREFVQKSAKKLDIEGHIQNAEDGSVLIVAAGQADALDDFIDYVYKGSAQAQVDEVAIEVATNGRDFRGVFRLIGADS